MSSLAKMLADPKMTVQEVAGWLDGLTHAGRMEAMSTSTKKQQARLWDLAADQTPITPEHFVPAGVPDRTEVIHHGRNTLPVFNFFQKRFARPEDGSPRFFGYNEGALRKLIGPGYFVAHDTIGNPTWATRGAWVVDYFQIPDGPVPDGWPRVVPNSRGIQIVVYHHTRDFMRKVSEHVAIGIAFKNETCMNNWFTLVREDRS